MSRSLKITRSRGSRTSGKGRNAGRKTQGGTGMAGSMTHNICKTVLLKRKALNQRKVTNYRDLESRLSSLIKKRYIVEIKPPRVAKSDQIVESESDIKVQRVYKLTKKFSAKYKKILSEGELSIKLKIIPYQVKLSKKAKEKLL